MKVKVPPLKSQGIKTKLVPWILAQLHDRSGTWIEPFMGTGVVGFNAAFEKATLGDINPHVIRFYSFIQSGEITPLKVKAYLEEQNELLRNAGDHGYDHYRKIKDRFNSKGVEGGSPLDFLFLNRAGFNGMMRFSKNGWNIPFCQKPDRFRQSYRTKIINQVEWVKNTISKRWIFKSSHFTEIISEAKAGDTLYCDPPYFGRHTDYFNKWEAEQEQELYEALSETKAHFILSTWHHNEWRKNESIEKFWKRFRIATKEHFYHAGAKESNRKPIVEALVMNFEPVEPADSIVEVDELDEVPFQLELLA